MLNNSIIPNEFNLMTLCVIDKHRNKSIWLEHDGNSNLDYFIYYNNSDYLEATNHCKICLRHAQYVGGDWMLTRTDLDQLFTILNEHNKRYKQLTNWQTILFKYNESNYIMDIEQFLNNVWEIKDYPNGISIKHAIPNYYNLLMK